MADSDITTEPYTLTNNDYVVFCVKTIYGNMLRWPLLVILVIVFGLIAIGLGISAGKPTAALTESMLGLLACLAMWLVALPAITLVASLQQIKATAGNLNARTLSADAGGVHFFGPSIDVNLTWSSFVSASSDRNLLRLYVTRNCAHLVRRSAFVSETAADDFLVMARERIAAAKKAPAATIVHQTNAAEADTVWQSEPFELTFRLFLPLFLRLQYAQFTNPLTYAALPVVIAFLGFVLRDRIGQGDWSGFLWGCFAIIIGAFFIPVLLAPLSWLATRKMAISKGKRKAALYPDHLWATGQSYDAKIKWSNMPKIARGRGAIYFYTRPAAAIAVPMSAFPDKVAADAFYHAALGYWAAARKTSETDAAKTTLDGKG